MGDIGKICKKDDWLRGTHFFTDFTFHAAAICFRFYALLDRLNVLEWSCTCAHSKCIRPPWPCLATHSGSKGLISAENKFTRSNFMSFSNHIIMTSVSGLYARISFKICQIVAGTSMISQFHEFFNRIFGGFWSLAQLCIRWAESHSLGLSRCLAGLLSLL